LGAVPPWNRIDMRGANPQMSDRNNPTRIVQSTGLYINGVAPFASMHQTRSAVRQKISAIGGDDGSAREPVRVGPFISTDAAGTRIDRPKALLARRVVFVPEKRRRGIVPAPDYSLIV
jgi:hypothetical protein